MNKKYYVAPSVRVLTLDSEDNMMQSASILNHESNNISVSLSDDEYDGEFSSRRNIWDED